MLIQLKYGGHIATPVAVIGRRPHGQHGLIKMPLVALHDELMRAAYEVDAVCLIEMSNHIAAEQVAGAPWTHTPANDFLRVRPEQIAHGTLMWHLLLPVYCSYLIQGGD